MEEGYQMTEAEGTRGLLFLLGVGGVAISVAPFFTERPSPWLVLEVPLYLLGAAASAGLFYVGVRFDRLLRERAQLAQFLLRVMLGVWLGRAIPIVVERGLTLVSLGALTVNPGLVLYTHWKYDRLQRTVSAA